MTFAITSASVRLPPGSSSGAPRGARPAPPSAPSPPPLRQRSLDARGDLPPLVANVCELVQVRAGPVKVPPGGKELAVKSPAGEERRPSLGQRRLDQEPLHRQALGRRLRDDPGLFLRGQPHLTTRRRPPARRRIRPPGRAVAKPRCAAPPAASFLVPAERASAAPLRRLPRRRAALGSGSTPPRPTVLTQVRACAARRSEARTGSDQVT